MKEYVKPMLPSEVSRPFDNKEWLFEKSFGGFRAISVINEQYANIYSHKNQSFNDYFLQLVKELRNLSSDAILDGEIVVLNDEGKPDVKEFWNYRGNQDLQCKYHVFDILSYQGNSLLHVPLIERKKILYYLINNFKIIKYTDFIMENGCDLYKAATHANLEGIVAKKMDSLYYPGKKSSEWLKIRNNSSQEVYICGFTRSSTGDKQISSIIAGIKEKDKFCYSGHIAAGLDNFYIQELYSQLIPLITDKSPFQTEIRSKKNIVWVHPVIKCEVKYLGLSMDHMMYQPVFLSLITEK